MCNYFERFAYLTGILAPDHLFPQQTCYIVKECYCINHNALFISCYDYRLLCIWKVRIFFFFLFKGTTQIVNKITPSGTPLVIQGLPLTILFIIIALVVFVIILCGLFVGTYVYKHCKRQPTAVYLSLKQQDGYDSLALDVQQQIGHSSPPIFLEPVSDTCSNYDDIDN